MEGERQGCGCSSCKLWVGNDEDNTKKMMADFFRATIKNDGRESTRSTSRSSQRQLHRGSAMRYYVLVGSITNCHPCALDGRCTRMHRMQHNNNYRSNRLQLICFSSNFYNSCKLRFLCFSQSDFLIFRKVEAAVQRLRLLRSNIDIRVTMRTSCSTTPFPPRICWNDITVSIYFLKKN